MSLSIATYNMQGFRAATIPYLTHLLNLFDIVYVQEHWLFESQFHLFKDKFPDTSSHCVSAMDSSRIHHGRGFGGCAIIWKSVLDCKVQPVQLQNTRACGVKVTLGDTSMFLSCLYLPCDDNVMNPVYSDVLNEVFSSSACHESDFLILGGDLNTDLSRIMSPSTRALETRCADENMVCVQKLNMCDIDYTYESKANGSRSCIDHFIVSENVCPLIMSCAVLHDGSNLSDHDPIVLKLSVNPTRLSSNCNHRPPPKPLWGKASTAQIEMYQWSLNAILYQIPHLGEPLCNNVMCNNSNCITNIQEHNDAIVEACIQASKATIPWTTRLHPVARHVVSLAGANSLRNITTVQLIYTEPGRLLVVRNRATSLNEEKSPERFTTMC